MPISERASARQGAPPQAPLPAQPMRSSQPHLSPYLQHQLGMGEQPITGLLETCSCDSSPSTLQNSQHALYKSRSNCSCKDHNLETGLDSMCSCTEELGHFRLRNPRKPNVALVGQPKSAVYNAALRYFSRFSGAAKVFRLTASPKQQPRAVYTQHGVCIPF